MKTVLIRGGKVFTPSGAVVADVLIKDGKIAEVGKLSPAADEVIDAEGACVAPGFIDIHTHGAGGADFMDGTVDAYLTAAKMYVRHGATLVYPTTCAFLSTSFIFSSSSVPIYRPSILYHSSPAVS